MIANYVWKLPSRKDKVLWSQPFSEESVGFMVQKSTEDHKWLFLLPFTWDVSCNQWLLTMVRIDSIILNHYHRLIHFRHGGQF